MAGIHGIDFGSVLGIYQPRLSVDSARMPSLDARLDAPTLKTSKSLPANRQSDANAKVLCNESTRSVSFPRCRPPPASQS